MSSMVAVGIGLGVSAAGSLYSGYTQSKMAKFNASLAREEAQAEEERGSLEEARFRKNVERFKGEQRARYAASGMTMEGSPLLVMEETAAEAEIDAILIRHASESRISSLKAEQSYYNTRAGHLTTAGLLSFGGKAVEGYGMAKKAGYFSGGGSTSAARMSGKGTSLLTK